jgi:uncharacterized membrane protein
MAENKLIHAIEEQEALDRLAVPLQHTVSAVLDRAPRLADFLHGRWIGHPLHAALVPIPIGAWTVGVGLDVADAFSRGRRFQRGADLATAIGLGGAGLAVFAGLADWSLTRDKARRVGLVHALLNTTVAALYSASLVSRKLGGRKLGVTLSTLGFGLAGVSGWLGGELSYHYGVGVRTAALDTTTGGEAGHATPEAQTPREARIAAAPR